LIALATQRVEQGWVIGYGDEVWWSRLAQPRMHSWCDSGQPLRLQEFETNKDDPDPKALCCYGLLRADSGKVWLRFVDGRPVSHVTTAWLEWVCERLASEGKKVLVLIWDNATWHVSREVRNWLRNHNRRALADRREGRAGIQIIPCFLPTKSPWLNNIEPKWIHSKRAVAEPSRKLAAQELTDRICAYFACDHMEHLEQNVS
jgi:transposase